MRLNELMRAAVHGLNANKLRSSLTMLGILIGVSAVILLVAVGNGSAKAVEDQLASLGSNTVTVSSSGPGFGRQSTSSQSLTLDMVDTLSDKNLAPDVQSVTPVQTTSQTVAAGSQSSTVTVTGTTDTWFEASNSPVADGEAFTTSDVDSSHRVAVIGSSTAEDLFPDTAAADVVGQQVDIAGTTFTIVGVLDEKDANGPNDPNATILAPITTVRTDLAGYGALSSIIVQATGPDTVTAVENEVTAILNHELGITDSDSSPFRILNQAQLLEARTSTADTFTVLLGAVAAISLLVGGIGVTNIMLVTVTERTREIGIRKALGAQASAITGQFLAEATFLTLLGGLAGVLVALVGSHFTIAGVQPVIVPGSIVLAFAVSAVIGLFFGSFPAARASRLQPIEALRYQ